MVPAGCESAAATKQRTIALWPKAALPWLSPETRRESRLPSVDRACRRDDAPALTTLHIVGLPKEGTVSPAGNSGARPTITLQAEGGTGAVDWLVDGKQVALTHDNGVARYTFKHGGQYRVTAMDEDGDFDWVNVTASSP